MNADHLAIIGDQFWARVDKGDDTDPDCCWLWLRPNGEPTKKYGSFRGLVATRVALELTTGQKVPDHLVVCHRCDNPPCVRPSHLFIGTNRDNAMDAIQKGRIVYPTRPKRPSDWHEHPPRQLTSVEALTAFRMWQAGQASNAIAQVMRTTRDVVWEAIQLMRIKSP